jgi:predicted carbohydrate-binding protein with CBM5 and CBM33 domain
MKKLFNLVKGNALSIIVMMVLMGIATWGIVYGPRSRVYDCSLAEFHPDFPVAVREECRRIKREASK